MLTPSPVCWRAPITSEPPPSIRASLPCSIAGCWPASLRASSTRFWPVLRVGFDGRDVRRKRTGVVNNAVHLARHLSATHRSQLIVYADRPPAAVDESPPHGVTLRTITAPPVLWKHAALPLALARDQVDVFHSP